MKALLASRATVTVLFVIAQAGLSFAAGWSTQHGQWVLLAVFVILYVVFVTAQIALGLSFRRPRHRRNP